MDVLMIILRLVHVLSGVFWAGATFIFASHVTPAVKASGPDGQKFMAALTARGRLSNSLGIAGILAVVSGWAMFFNNNWHQDRTINGIVLGIGAVLGTLGFLHGAIVQRKAIMEMAAMGMRAAAAGGPPSPELAAEMGRQAGKIERNGVILAYILGLTVAAMASFPYF